MIEFSEIFCAQQLYSEYFQLCEKLILKLGRKRDVPFRSGKIEIWAAAVVYAIGSINFLFDKSFEPYLTAEQIRREVVPELEKQLKRKSQQGKHVLDSAGIRA